MRAGDDGEPGPRSGLDLSQRDQALLPERPDRHPFPGLLQPAAALQDLHDAPADPPSPGFPPAHDACPGGHRGAARRPGGGACARPPDHRADPPSRRGDHPPPATGRLGVPVSRRRLHRRPLSHRTLSGVRRPPRPPGRRLSLRRARFRPAAVARRGLPGGPRARHGRRAVRRGGPRRGHLHEHVLAERLEVSGSRLPAFLLGHGHDPGQPSWRPRPAMPSRRGSSSGSWMRP